MTCDGCLPTSWVHVSADDELLQQVPYSAFILCVGVNLALSLKLMANGMTTPSKQDVYHRDNCIARYTVSSIHISSSGVVLAMLESSLCLARYQHSDVGSIKDQY